MALLQEAVAIAPQSIRPRIELAKVLHRLQRTHEAYRTLVTLAQEAPQGFPLAAPLFLEVAAASHPSGRRMTCSTPPRPAPSTST